MRAVAVLAVVLFHMQTVETKYSGGDTLLPAFFEAGQLGVDLFFVISGFVMVTVTRGRFGGAGEIPRFLWHRLTRIYPTYWFYYALVLTVFLIQPSWVNSAQGNQADLWQSFLLYPTDRLPLVMVAWSLTHELWFYLVFALFMLGPESHLKYWLTIWACAIVASNLLLEVGTMPAPLRVVVHGYSLEFILGAGVAMLTTCDWTSRIHGFASILVAVAVGGLMLAWHYAECTSPGLSRAFAFGSVFALLVAALVISEKHADWCFPRVLTRVGDRSYTIYLSHILVLAVVGRAWAWSGASVDSLLDNVAACLLMLAAVLIFGRVGYDLVERPLLRLTQRIRRLDRR